MTNGQKMRKLFEEKKLVVAPGCHDALTAKIISYLGFDAVYMTGYGQSASHLGQPDVDWKDLTDEERVEYDIGIPATNSC